MPPYVPAQQDPPVIWATPAVMGFIRYDFDTQQGEAQEALAALLGANIEAYKVGGYYQGETPENQTRVYFPASYTIRHQSFTDRSFRKDFVKSLVLDGSPVYRHRVGKWQKGVRNDQGVWEWRDVRDRRLPNPPLQP